MLQELHQYQGEGHLGENGVYLHTSFQNLLGHSFAKGTIEQMRKALLDPGMCGSVLDECLFLSARCNAKLVILVGAFCMPRRVTGTSSCVCFAGRGIVLIVYVHAAVSPNKGKVYYTTLAHSLPFRGTFHPTHMLRLNLLCLQ